VSADITDSVELAVYVEDGDFIVAGLRKLAGARGDIFGAPGSGGGHCSLHFGFTIFDYNRKS
jgi:hypothetical protein